MHEWSALAQAYSADGRHNLAHLAHGWAKCPVLADEAKHASLERQIEEYVRAAPGAARQRRSGLVEDGPAPAAGPVRAARRVRVMAFVLPGTGETRVPMTADGGFEIVRGLVEHARGIGNGRVGHFGFSMGGYYAAHSGLSGLVDAAVDLGGPIRDSFTEGNLKQLMFGMADIFGNALGFDHQPEPHKVLALLTDYPLKGLDQTVR